MDDPVATAPGAVPVLNTIDDAARKLSSSKAWLHGRIKAGEIRTVHLSKRSVFVTDDEIIRYLAARGADVKVSA